MQIFFGVVESRADPMRLGRMQVRVNGVHSALLSDVATVDLPWAVPIQNSSPGMSGIGKSPEYLEGSTVAVIFADSDFQVPMILGSIAGVQSQQGIIGLTLTPIQEDLKLIPPVAPPTNPETPFIGPLNTVQVLKLIRRLSIQVFEDAGRLGIYKVTLNDLKSLSLVKADGTWATNENPPEIEYESMSAAAQKDIIQELMRHNYIKLRQLGVISDITPIEKLAGVLYACHLNGPEAVEKYVKKSEDPTGTMFELYRTGYAEITNVVTYNPPTNDTINRTVESENGLTTVLDSQGFKDPNKKYPLPDHEGESDISRLSTGTSILDTCVGYKDATLTKDVKVANSKETWSQSPVPYKAEYPHNNVYQSASGHVLEFDDTKGSERVHLYHTQGSFIEIDSDGNRTDVIKGTRTIIIDKDELVYIKGAGHVTIDGDMSLKVNNALQVEITGSANIKVGGDVNYDVAGSFNVKAGANINLSGVQVNADGFAGTNNGSATSNVVEITPEYAPGIVTPNPLNFNQQKLIDSEQTIEGQQLASRYSSLQYKILETNDTPPTRNQQPKILRKLTALTPQTNLNSEGKPTLTIKDFCIGNYCRGFPFGSSNIGIPAADLAKSMQALTANCIEPIFANFKQYAPVFNSAFRTTSPTSGGPDLKQHGKGQAVDIGFEGLKNHKERRKMFYDIAVWIKDNVLFDQLILEYQSSGAIWIHISFNDKAAKQGQQVRTFNDHKSIASGSLVLIEYIK